MQGGIFVNYRRSFLHLEASGVVHDSEPNQVEGITDRLKRHFGHSQVFLDVNTLEPGEPYPEELRRRLARSEVLITMIGHHWLAETEHRQTLPGKDWVRWEIAEALRTGKVVIPVLLGEAPRVPAERLPDDLRDLAPRQDIRLRSGTFAADVDRLIQYLERHVAPTWQPPPFTPPTRPRRWATVAALAVPAVLVPLVPMSANRRDTVQAAADGLLFSTYTALLLLGALLLVAALYRWREPIDVMGKHVMEAPRLVFLALGVGPIILAGTVATMQVVERLGAVSFAPLIAVGFAMILSFFAIVQYQQSQPWPPLLDAKSTEPLPRLRQAIARYRERTAGWSPPLSRVQRDQTRWFRDRLIAAAEELRAGARRSRIGRVAAMKPVMLFVTSLVFALGSGMLLTAAIFGYDAGHRGGRLVGDITPSIVAVLASLLIIELLYRYERWLDARAADEVAAYVEELNEIADLADNPAVPEPRPRPPSVPADTSTGGG